MAIDAGVPVQQLEYAQLRGKLLADKQILETQHAIKGSSGKEWPSPSRIWQRVYEQLRHWLSALTTAGG